jgi:hypothetical protein
MINSCTIFFNYNNSFYKDSIRKYLNFNILTCFYPWYDPAGLPCSNSCSGNNCSNCPSKSSSEDCDACDCNSCNRTCSKKCEEKPDKDGVFCRKCKDFIPLAEPDGEENDNKITCYRCKK